MNPRSNKVSDIKLATATQNIDLIFGGHTHTFRERPTVKKIRLVNQVGCFGIYLGRIDFYLESENNIEADGVKIVVS